MVDYLTDIGITEERDIRIDDTNDIYTVSEQTNLQQGISLSTMDVTNRFVGEHVSAEQLGLLEERVEEYLESDPHVGSVLRVQTETYNRESDRVTMQISLTEGDFSIELNV